MPRHQIDTSTLDKDLAAGLGSGRGAAYQPWRRVQQDARYGLATRERGWKTGRVHHFFTQLQFAYFLVLEWAPVVVDIREHYPLVPFEETYGLAQRYGFKHPLRPRQGYDLYTVDVLVTRSTPQGLVELARSLVSSKALASPATLATLEIQRCFWAARGLDWGIVTEHQVPAMLVQNMRVLHGYRTLDDRGLDDALVQRIQMVLTPWVAQGMPLGTAATACDAHLKAVPGQSLAAAYHLMATRRWLLDMRYPLHPTRPVIFQRDPMHQPEEDPHAPRH